MFEEVKESLMYFFYREHSIARDIIDTIKLPISGKVSHIEDIFIDIDEIDLRRKLKDCILREHKSPIQGIDNVVSVNVWPEIYRYIIKDGKAVAAIIESGVYSNKFGKVFNRIKDRVTDLFAYSIKEYSDKSSKYSTYTWECSKHYCYLQVLNDQYININSLFYDYDYFGREIDGTHIIIPKTHYTVLRTIAIVLAKEQYYMALVALYLKFDLIKRQDSISLLNCTTFFER